MAIATLRPGRTDAVAVIDDESRPRKGWMTVEEDVSDRRSADVDAFHGFQPLVMPSFEMLRLLHWNTTVMTAGPELQRVSDSSAASAKTTEASKTTKKEKA